jgi:hypothetical protein
LDEVIDIGVGNLGISQFQDPGAMLNLVLLMQAGIVAGAGLPHFPKDFEPALAQTAAGGPQWTSAGTGSWSVEWGRFRFVSRTR